ncbi:hypothetical protein LX32DRAFT_639491 [Colletotrichum zoysiae]|uniref:Uncharacterized protein n=1 Tax=Colletotrichum zoysiae TaxID=1216348 RepID=A0AAD9M1X6_9PEZI|nr:hypothetical protein LX32DRAFT_639491 [Colletotrichum zoysiae]
MTLRDKEYKDAVAENLPRQYRNGHGPSPPESSTGSVPPHFDVIKQFPPRGKWQLHRLGATAKFTCCQCKRPKTSKLVAVEEGQWSQLCCNGCYGTRLLDS